ncbi:MAG TPA: histidine kinase dimerization/phospho-acceptor domain-containing protein, partial [Desulfuromonadales bacterium]|nr:histidine kinase dimerization/phospho-acceptor domain-containing protein [Desulfuromonadales bacterium]
MQTGLRTEVVVSISFLLGAALLFSGFLLVKLTEKELLDQKRTGLRQTMVLLSAAFAEQLAAGGSETANRQAELRPVLASLDLQEDVLGWRVISTEGVVAPETSAGAGGGFQEPSAATMDRGSVGEYLQYSSSWKLFAQEQRSYLELTAPLAGGWETAGFLQVRFSLAALEGRVHRAQQLVLAYVLLYGLVLTLFGVYALNRNIVRPVRRLQQASADVAEGALKAVDVPAGPAEIRDLATSFNQMVQALSASRAEAEAHIASLQEANRALGQAQEDLLRSEKMASVGHLSAGMAHEIGNPLGAIVGYLNLLARDPDDPSARELVARSLKEAGRIDRLIRELLDYA